MGNNVGKGELVREIAKTAGITQDQAEAVLTAALDLIKAHTDDGRSVILKGFGTFKTKISKARVARNPGTGATINVPEKHKMVFKVSATA